MLRTFRCADKTLLRVINNGRMEVKNSLVWKQRMSRVPGRRMQI